VIDDRRDPEVGEAVGRLPVPPATETFFTELDERLRNGGAAGRGVGRAAVVLVVTAVVFALIGGVVGAAVRGSTPEPTTTEATADDEPAEPADVISFRPAAGWNTASFAYTGGRADLPVAWATNTELVNKGGGIQQMSELAKLPVGGIYVEAYGPRPGRAAPGFEPLRAPLALEDARCFSEDYEGKPAPTIAYCYFDRRVGEDEILNVSVWINHGSEPWPAPGLVDEADDALARLEVPAG
jgi:hypothetical protein